MMPALQMKTSQSTREIPAKSNQKAGETQIHSQLSFIELNIQHESGKFKKLK